jgi:hypothetical protein
MTVRYRQIAALLIGAVLGSVLLMLSGCSVPDIDRFKEGEPSLSLAEFFAGETIAYGIFEDRFGQLKRQFRVHIYGHTEQGKLILDEQFLYDDGEQAQRIWTITSTQTKDGFIRYEGSADDVTGTATGKAAGNVLSWSYDIELAIGDNDIEVRFDDFIYQMSNNLAINRAHVTKWGVELGTVTLVFLRGKLAQSELADNNFQLERW